MKKYELVADKIKDYINKEQLHHGYKLPTITDLMKKYQVGKSTILQAITLLTQRGIVYKVQGSGVFVRPTGQDGYMSLTDNAGFAHVLKKPTTEVIEFSEKKAPKPISEHLHSNEECYFIKRLRKQDGKPFVLEESYYRKSIIPFMSKEIAEGSIFDYIREGLKKEIRFSDKYMRVRKLTADEAKYLELKEGDPCLEVYDTFYLANGTAFDSSKLVYNYKNSKFYDQSSDDII